MAIYTEIRTLPPSPMGGGLVVLRPVSCRNFPPLLIGMHNHTFYTTQGRSVQLNYSSPRLYLSSGVTTIRTTGATSP